MAWGGGAYLPQWALHLVVAPAQGTVEVRLPDFSIMALVSIEAAAPLPWVYGRLEVPVRFELGTRR